MEPKIKKVIANLKSRNMEGFFVENKEQAVEKLLSLIDKDKEIGFGWSTTLLEIELVEKLKNEGYNILDRFDEKLTIKELIPILKKTQQCDILITGSNALTEDGKIVNKDGTGTRVSPMIYGPELVIVVVGKNKIVRNVEEAIDRIEETAAPMNCKRKNLKTPCVKTGHCVDCRHQDRICCTTTVFEYQRKKNRMKVIVVNEELGF